MLKDGWLYEHSGSFGQEPAPAADNHSAIFDATLFGENATAVIPILQHYLSDDSIRGLQLIEPELLLQKAKALMTSENDGIVPLDTERLKAILKLYIKTGIQVHSPGFMGRQFSGVVPLTGVIDMVSSVVNQPSSFYEAGQLPNVAEHIMAETLNQFIGYDPDAFTMITTSGGSLANLTALLAARNHYYPDVWARGMASMHKDNYLPAIAVSEDAHYSVSRAAGILGIGENQIVRLPVNEARQIDIDQVATILDKALEDGLKVFCLVASAGSTSMGCFDPIDELGDIAGSRNIWLHVDGAHGASLLVSDELRYKLKGIHKADSLTWDAHKMLFVPSPCSLLFYKHKERSYGAFHQVASYVFDKEPNIYTEFESAEKNFECTKRPMIMNLWVLWALHGRALFSDKIEHLCRLARQAHYELEKTADFEPVNYPECNILCFKYLPSTLDEAAIPDFQVEIRNRICAKGKFFISKVDINDQPVLRVVFMNHEITLAHFRMLLHEVAEAGNQLICEYKKQHSKK